MKAEQGVLCVVFGDERVARATEEVEGEGADFAQSARAHFQDLAAVVPIISIISSAEDEHAAVEARRAGL